MDTAGSWFCFRPATAAQACSLASWNLGNRMVPVCGDRKRIQRVDVKPQHSPGPTPCGLLLPLVSAPNVQVLLHHLHPQLVTLGGPHHSRPNLAAASLSPGFLCTSHPPGPRPRGSDQCAQMHTQQPGRRCIRHLLVGPSAATSCRVTSGKCVRVHTREHVVPCDPRAQGHSPERQPPSRSSAPGRQSVGLWCPPGPSQGLRVRTVLRLFRAAQRSLNQSHFHRRGFDP